MCLSDDWFKESKYRIENWEKNGISIKEAQSNLLKYRSTIYPVATEVAEFIFSNWGARMVARLGKEYREILFDIWDKELDRLDDLAYVSLGGIPFLLVLYYDYVLITI